MVRITHINGDEKLVTKGAFESIFKPLGYKLKTAEKAKEFPKVEKKHELTGDEEEVVSRNKNEDRPKRK